MKNVNHLLAMSVHLALLTLATCSVEALTIHFQSNGNMLKQSQLRVGRNFLGFMGDVVDLHDGTHRIYVNAPRGYTLQFTLTVQGRELNLVNTDHFPRNCDGEVFDINWPFPNVVDSTEYKDVKVIVLSDPQFGRSLGRSECHLFATLTCTKRKVILRAESEPSGAEIWIENEKMPFPTNATLSVPYCKHESSKEVVLRKDGMINCRKTIQLSPDSRVLVACKLRWPTPTN